METALTGPGRRLLEYDVIYIPIGSIIALVILSIALLRHCFGCGDCSLEEAMEEEARSREEIGPYVSPTSTASQMIRSTSTSPGVIQVRNIDPDHFYSKAELEAMSIDELKLLKERLNLSHLAPMPFPEFIDYVMALQQEADPNHIYTKAELEAMSVDELKALKERLNLGHLPPMPFPEFIELVMGVQRSLQTSSVAEEGGQPAAAPPPPATPQPSLLRSASQSTRNKDTGLLECGICNDPMGGGALKPMAVPPCGHCFCYECLLHVAQTSGKCPSCRQAFRHSNITRVYS